MPRQWRIGIVGLGVVGGMHLRALEKLLNLRLTAVCDRLPDKAREALANHRLSVPVYADLTEMLRTEKLDAVHVGTPSGDHRDPAITVMSHGVNCLVEKPMEIVPDRIDEMIAASRKYGVRLAGVFQNRWNEANIALREAVRQNRFGRIGWIGVITPWYRTDKYYEEGGWRGTWKWDGGGAVMNQGVHQVDQMQWIGGPVKSVSAFAGARIHANIEVEDTLTCAVHFESGAFGTFVSTTAMWPGATARIEIGGEFGSAISENGLKRFEFKTPLPGDKELIERLAPGRSKDTAGGKSAGDVGLDLHGRNFQAVYEAWEQNRDADTSGPEARKAVAIIQAMYESSRNNGVPVAV